MKFYDCTTAPSPRRVRIFLAEKGITVPTVQVDLRSGEHLQPAFRKINPECTVPVLELDAARSSPTPSPSALLRGAAARTAADRQDARGESQSPSPGTGASSATASTR